MHALITRGAPLLAMLLAMAPMSPVGAQAREGGAEHRPPPEAYAACAAATTGQACSVKTPQGAVEGACWAVDEKSLACRPKNGPPPGGPGAPPPESLAACAALVAGQACSVASPGGTLQGACFAPEGKPLACRPNRPPGGPMGAARESTPPGAQH
jgi:hypothetical protein